MTPTPSEKESDRSVSSRIAALRPHDALQLVVLAGLLVSAELQLRLRRVDDVARFYGLTLEGVSTDSPPDDSPHLTLESEIAQLVITPDERRWGRNVARIVRRWPWDRSCLRRSLLLGWTLRSRHPQLVIGARDTDGNVTAHAWVRLGVVDLDPGAANHVTFY